MAKEIKITSGDFSTGGHLKNVIEVNSVSELLNLQSDDPSFLSDIIIWCGHHCAFIHSIENEYIFTLILSDPDFIERMDIPDLLQPIFFGVLDAAKKEFGNIKEDIFLLLRL